MNKIRFILICFIIENSFQREELKFAEDDIENRLDLIPQNDRSRIPKIKYVKPIEKLKEIENEKSKGNENLNVNKQLKENGNENVNQKDKLKENGKKEEITETTKKAENNKIGLLKNNKSDSEYIENKVILFFYLAVLIL